MELNNDFEVKAPLDKTWATLVDVEKIAPCLPGAQLQEIEGDEYRGIVKVKVGPITAQYKGKAIFLEQDDANHKAVLKGDGRDTRGAGNASAIITAQAEAVSESVTRVTVNTDLTVTGKVAQFGRGVMADVSAKLMDQFAENLEELLANEPAGEAATAAPPPPPAEAAAAAATDTAASSSSSASSGSSSTDGVRKINHAPTEAVDLLETAGAPVAKRLIPVAGAIAAVLVLRRIFG